MRQSTILHDRFRSVSLALLAPLAAVKDISLVSIQHGDGMAQLDDLPIVNLGRQLDEMARRAQRDVDAHRLALSTVVNLDLIATSDTMMAYLAGALAQTVWLLVCSAPDWRWQYGRSDNVWYPTMRIFRQPTPGDWSGVVAQVKRALVHLVNQPTATAA